MLRIPTKLALAMAACLAFCLILALNWIPELRGDFGWRWPYGLPDWPRLLPAVITITVYIVGLRRIQRPALFQVWCFTGAVAIPVACLYVLGDPLYLLVTRTLSGAVTGAHMAGTEIADLGVTLRTWPQLMPTYIQAGEHAMMSVHIAIGPPGLPAFYYILNRLAEAVPVLSDPLGMALRPFQCQNYAIMAYSNAQLASAWFGVLMPVWAALTVFPLYRAGGKLAAAGWPLIPSAALFTPGWNTFFPVLAIIAYLLLDQGLTQFKTRRGVLLIILAGVVVSLATFVNFSSVPLIGLFGLYVGFFFIHRDGLQVRKVLVSASAVSVVFLFGVSLLWIGYYVGFGVTPITLLTQALGQHLELERPYLPWVYLHLYDLALFTGFPLVWLALVRVWQSLCAGRRFDWQTIDPLSLALAASLIILAVSGTARGETGRVWLFFVPFMLMVAARYLENLYRTRGLSPLYAMMSVVTVIQAITLLTLVAFLRVVSTEFNPPPAAPPVQEAVANPQPISATFADSFTLIGWRGVANSDGIDLTLVWRSDRQTAYPYYLSVLVVGPHGRPLASAINWQPFDTNYPITCWRPGQFITETRHLPMGDTAPPGNYWISLSAFALLDGKGVPVSQPEAPIDTQIGLGPVQRNWGVR